MLQWSLQDQGLKEYHIMTTDDTRFLQAFSEGTGKRFVSAVLAFIEDNFRARCKRIERGVFYNGERKEYIWVHLPESTAHDDMTDIMAALREKYQKDWIKHRVRKLTTILKDHLEQDREYLAQAVSYYQRDNGFDAAANALHITFRHINVNRFDSDALSSPRSDEST
jgi:hypothetical protein